VNLGRYTLHREIARGGMASVHVGHVRGAANFSRAVAIKRMLPKLAADPEFRAMFIDEATLASRIQHPNVVPTLDVVAEDGELFLVMELVRGESLASLLRTAVRIAHPVRVDIAVSVVCGVLGGLHAAHEACDGEGTSLAIVHRDVTPHNILVGADGVARIMDFGVAKAHKQLHRTVHGELKGKPSYMAPEQIERDSGALDRRVDVYAAAVVCWTLLSGQRLFAGGDMTETIAEVLRGAIPPLSLFRADVPAALEAVLHRAMAKDRAHRWPSAQAFAEALERAAPRVATAREVGDWVRFLAGPALDARAAEVRAMEAAIAGARREEAWSDLQRTEVRGRRPFRWAAAAVLAAVALGALVVVRALGGGTSESQLVADESSPEGVTVPAAVSPPTTGREPVAPPESTGAPLAPAATPAESASSARAPSASPSPEGGPVRTPPRTPRAPAQPSGEPVYLPERP
jgi:eukaryotic-like serine/threonine-protein kinase